MGNLKVRMFGRGLGHATLIEVPDSKSGTSKQVLFDCGPISDMPKLEHLQQLLAGSHSSAEAKLSLLAISNITRRTCLGISQLNQLNMLPESEWYAWPQVVKNIPTYAQEYQKFNNNGRSVGLPNWAIGLREEIDSFRSATLEPGDDPARKHLHDVRDENLFHRAEQTESIFANKSTPSRRVGDAVIRFLSPNDSAQLLGEDAGGRFLDDTTEVERVAAMHGLESPIQGISADQYYKIVEWLSRERAYAITQFTDRVNDAGSVMELNWRGIKLLFCGETGPDVWSEIRKENFSGANGTGGHDNDAPEIPFHFVMSRYFRKRPGLNPRICPASLSHNSFDDFDLLVDQREDDNGELVAMTLNDVHDYTVVVSSDVRRQYYELEFHASNLQPIPDGP